ncbi:hypothetical protein BRC97_10620 [Halobacteriales archaeon QS_6_71_20]|nr:MAG: hypothetical protein BRC97_10620 [Halobacteriales archaeon QS_6_71_20]
MLIITRREPAGTPGTRRTVRMPTIEPHLYREAFRETVDPTVIADTDLVITDANAAARELTGRSREELVGSTPRRFVDDDVYEEIVETVRDGDPWIGEFECTSTNGRVAYARGSVSPLVVDGRTRGYVAVFADTTRNRRYEESLRILNRVLRHNLRNDANVVLGHIERVADEVADRVDPPEVTGLLDSLDTASDRIDDMLDRARTTRRFSGVLAGDNGTLRPVDLATAVEDAVADAPTAGVEVADEVSGPVPVIADEMLSAALHAVVENAVEHNDSSEPRLTLAVTEHREGVVLSVADNGPGIDPSRYDEIFGNGEHTQVEHGEGLSLFFVHRLMELYGGGVSVRPNEPEGTVFDLRFRRPGADSDAPAGRDAASLAGPPTDGVGHPRTLDPGEPSASLRSGTAEGSTGGTAGAPGGGSDASTDPAESPAAGAPGRSSDGDLSAGRDATDTSDAATAARRTTVPITSSGSGGPSRSSPTPTRRCAASPPRRSPTPPSSSSPRARRAVGSRSRTAR